VCSVHLANKMKRACHPELSTLGNEVANDQTFVIYFLIFAMQICVYEKDNELLKSIVKSMNAHHFAYFFIKLGFQIGVLADPQAYAGLYSKSPSEAFDVLWPKIIANFDAVKGYVLNWNNLSFCFKAMETNSSWVAILFQFATAGDLSFVSSLLKKSVVVNANVDFQVLFAEIREKLKERVAENGKSRKRISLGQIPVFIDQRVLNSQIGSIVDSVIFLFQGLWAYCGDEVLKRFPGANIPGFFFNFGYIVCFFSAFKVLIFFYNHFALAQKSIIWALVVYVVEQFIVYYFRVEYPSVVHVLLNVICYFGIMYITQRRVQGIFKEIKILAGILMPHNLQGNPVVCWLDNQKRMHVLIKCFGTVCNVPESVPCKTTSLFFDLTKMSYRQMKQGMTILYFDERVHDTTRQNFERAGQFLQEVLNQRGDEMQKLKVIEGLFERAKVQVQNLLDLINYYWS